MSISLVPYLNFPLGVSRPAFEHYREIFNITRLSDFMTVFADEESALREVVAAA